MFRTPKPNVIESDKGFSVEHVGFTTLEYKEGNKKVRIGFEYLTGPILFVLYIGSTDHWDPPFEAEKISRDDWYRIGSNVREAYRSQGREITMQGPWREESEA